MLNVSWSGVEPRILCSDEGETISLRLGYRFYIMGKLQEEGILRCQALLTFSLRLTTISDSKDLVF